MNLAVLDTQTPFSITQFTDYNTIAWLTNDSVFAVDDGEGKVQGFELAAIEDFTLDAVVVDQFISRISGFLKFFVPLIGLLMWGAIFGFNVIWGMIYLLFLGTLISITGSIMKRELDFAQSYRMGLYAMTISYLVGFVFWGLKAWTPFTPFVFMSTLIVMAVVVLNLKNSAHGFAVSAKKKS